MTIRNYINRSIEKIIRQAAGDFPAVILTGPRQTGKTTTLKRVFSETHGYISFEAPDVRLAAESDPRRFIEMYPAPVIFDEIQHAPGLFSYIKERIDAKRQVPGQYILTGSQNLLLMEKVKESLAGRAAILRLLPISHRELTGSPYRPLPWERGEPESANIETESGNIWEELVRGGYPELAANPGRDKYLWHSSYVQTYLERDVRSLKQIGDLGQFQNFLRLLAVRSGNLFNMSSLAKDLGISVNTVKSWISILEATYQIVLLKPYHANIGKRLVKMPKVYFTDTGTLCYLSGIRDSEQAATGPMAGVIFETAVMSEIYKTYTHKGEEPVMYFWRTSSGSEVDVLVETGGKMIAIEISTNTTVRPGKAAEIKKLMKDLGGKVHAGYVIHPGELRLPLGDGITGEPFVRI